MDQDDLIVTLNELVREGCKKEGIIATALLVPSHAGQLVELSAVKTVGARKYNFEGMLKTDELTRLGPAAIAGAFNAQAIHALAHL